MRPSVVLSLFVMLLATCGSLALSRVGAATRGGGSAALFTDRFASAASLSHWRIDQPERWSVVKGHLRAEMPREKQQKSIARVGGKEWTDVAVDLDLCGIAGVDKGVALRVDGDDGVGVDLRGGQEQDIVIYRGFTKLGGAPAPNRNGKWYHLRVEARGDAYRVLLDRRLVLEVKDEGGPGAGGIALPAYTGGAGECIVLVDNVVVTPLASTAERASR